MLQHTSLDDFLRGLYVKATEAPGAAPKQTQHDKLLAQLMGTTAEGDTSGSKDSGPQLMFEEQTASVGGAGGENTIDMFRGDNLRKMALQNLKDRRQRQKQSEIFN